MNSQLEFGDRMTDSSHKVVVRGTMNLADVGGDKRAFDRSEIAIVFDTWSIPFQPKMTIDDRRKMELFYRNLLKKGK